MPSNTFAQREIDSATRHAKLLIVDEEAGDLRTLCSILEGQGFEVFACASYEAGIQFLEIEPFDFVLVSQGTKAFEGRKVLTRARELDRHLPVLVVARCLEIPCYLDAMHLGATDYMVKPISPTRLLGFVRAHIQYRRRRTLGNATSSAVNPKAVGGRARTSG